MAQLASGQQYSVKGKVVDSLGQSVPNVSIFVLPDSIGTVTDQDGFYQFQVEGGPRIFRLTHINFEVIDRRVSVVKDTELNIELKEKITLLKGVKVEESLIPFRNDQQLVRIAPKNLEGLPSATGDFTKILATLPGVSANSELSSVYSVRGGNYDENLVYDEIENYLEKCGIFVDI